MMCRPEPISELALQVKWLATPSAHPDFITVEADVSHDGVPVELENWGFRIRAVLCDERSVAVCLNLKADEDQTYEYVFVNLDVEDDTDILVHSSPKVLSTSDLMATLYKLGFWRAVINTTETVEPGLFKVTFRDQKVAPMTRSSTPKRTAVWPLPHFSKTRHAPFFTAPEPYQSDQLIDIGISLDDLQELFKSHVDVLLRDFDGHDLPAEVQHALQACDASIPLADLDRLLIYTDGSSMGFAKHMAPLRAEEGGVGDTWAYVILGERYHPPGLRFIRSTTTTWVRKESVRTWQKKLFHGQLCGVSASTGISQHVSGPTLASLWAKRQAAPALPSWTSPLSSSAGPFKRWKQRWAESTLLMIMYLDIQAKFGMNFAIG